MKIFISQKMRYKTHEEILKERKAIEEALDNALNEKDGYNAMFTRFCDYGYPLHQYEIIQSYEPELKHKSPIEALSHSLAMLDEANIVLVPKAVKQAIDDFMKENVQPYYASGFGETAFVVPSISEKLLSVDLLKGCEFEFLIALSYGKKVYTYDENYTFEEV